MQASNQAGALPQRDGLFVYLSATAATDVESTSTNLEEEGQMRKYLSVLRRGSCRGICRSSVRPDWQWRTQRVTLQPEHHRPREGEDG